MLESNNSVELYLATFYFFFHVSHHIHSVFSLTAAQNLFLLASIITISLSAEPHFCPAGCHEGPCPRCEKSRLVRCLCGRGSTRVECQNLEGIGDFVCDKPCNKMKSCGRHRCNTRCCMVSLSLSLSLSLKKGEKYVAEWGICPLPSHRMLITSVPWCAVRDCGVGSTTAWSSAIEDTANNAGSIVSHVIVT